MPLDEAAATAEVRRLLGFRDAEKKALDKVHDYLRGRQPNVAVPAGSPREVQKLAKISRVNLMQIVISALAQALYVDGYRGARDAENAPAWDIWQANALDEWQIGIHRAALTYGTAYASVVPGDPVPVITGHSPRVMTALYYDDDPYWPGIALQTTKGGLLRLYDQTSVYTFKAGATKSSDIEFVKQDDHDLGYVPIVRFLNCADLDDDNAGEVEPLMDLQDQIDLTTFSLLVAQHYLAFKQRWIIGWTSPSEADLVKLNASRLLTLGDHPDDVKVGEFDATDLTGYLESREASIRHAASLSQTPVHELTASLVNLSAEALVAAEAGQRRKIVERQVTFGESWEQVLKLAGQIANVQLSDNAEVRWRDTESRALSALVDALGKMATQLGIPPQELWDRLPNTSDQDIARWKDAAKENDALANLTQMIDSAMNGETSGNRPPGAPRQLPAPAAAA